MGNVSLVQPNDIDEIEPLCQRAFYQVDYHLPPRSLTYSSEHIRGVISRGIDSSDHLLTKYIKHDRVVGFMAVGLTDFSFYSVGQRQAYEIVWHGDPLLPPVQQLVVQKILLIDMIKRMIAKNVDLFSVTLDSKYLGIERILLDLGFQESNRTFIRRM